MVGQLSVVGVGVISGMGLMMMEGLDEPWEALGGMCSNGTDSSSGDLLSNSSVGVGGCAGAVRSGSIAAEMEEGFRALADGFSRFRRRVLCYIVTCIVPPAM